MTDEELDELEAILKNKSPVSVHREIYKKLVADMPDIILNLISEIRQTRKEKNWIIQNRRAIFREDLF